MKEPLYIDCCTTKIKVISINGQLEQSKILLRANENSEQKQANCHRRKEMLSVIRLRVVNHFTWDWLQNLCEVSLPVLEDTCRKYSLVAVRKVQNTQTERCRTTLKLNWYMTLLSISSKSKINTPHFTHLKAKHLLVHDGYYLRIYRPRCRIHHWQSFHTEMEQRHLEGFSIECRKAKTKAATTANHSQENITRSRQELEVKTSKPPKAREKTEWPGRNWF